MDKELHTGHRERLRKKFKHNALLEDHEILELLLFYVIPRQNTNEIAHRLIRHFGSFRRVFEADLTELQEIAGIGEHAALFLRLLAETIGRYSRDTSDLSHPLNCLSDLSKYLCSLFVGTSKEKVYVILLSTGGRLLHTESIGNGFSSLSEVSVRRISELAVRMDAAQVVLAHNHPEGSAKPSQADIDATLRLQYVLQQLGIPLLDHFVVAGDQCTPILHGGFVL